MEAVEAVAGALAVLMLTAAMEATDATVTAPQKAMAETRTLLLERRPEGLESAGLHMVDRVEDERRRTEEGRRIGLSWGSKQEK